MGSRSGSDGRSGGFRSIFWGSSEKKREKLRLSTVSPFWVSRFHRFSFSFVILNCNMMLIEDFPFNPLIKDAFIAFVALSIVLDLFYRIVWAPKVVREKKDYELFVYRYFRRVTCRRSKLFTLQHNQHNQTAHSQAASLSVLDVMEHISTLRRVNIYLPRWKPECTENRNASTISVPSWSRT